MSAPANPYYLNEESKAILRAELQHQREKRALRQLALQLERREGERRVGDRRTAGSGPASLGVWS